MNRLTVALMLVGAALCGVAEGKVAEATTSATPVRSERPAAKAAKAKPKAESAARQDAQKKAFADARKAKMAEVLRKYGVAEDKLGDCVEELIAAARQRPSRPVKTKAPAKASPSVDK